MKKVLSSKGIFSITNSLYESIKKNNPELLLEDIWNHTGSNDSGMNLFIINSLVDDIFKNEKNKNKRSINSIKQKVENIYKNRERNSLNVLDAFDDAKDYLYKVKKEYDEFKSMEDDEQRNNQTQAQIQRNNQTQSNEGKLNNVENVFGTSVRDNINDIINNPNMPDEYIDECIKRYGKDLLEKYPNGFFKKDKKTIVKDIRAIIKKVREDCEELLKYIRMFNDSQNHPPSPATDSETVMFNNNEQEQQEIDNDSESPSGPNSESSSEYEVVPQRERELVYAESFKMSLKKILKEDDEEFNLNDLNDENNNENNRIENLDQLFLIFSKYGIEEVKRILDNNENIINNINNINNIDRDFENYINNYKFGGEIKIKEFIEKILKEYKIPEQYIDKTIKRYMKDFRKDFSDNDYLKNDYGKEIKTKRNKEDMEEIYNKVKNDCKQLKKLIDSARNNTNDMEN